MLTSGLSIMLQSYARVDGLELGGIVASCIVLYDVMSFSETLQDILKHMLFALLFLVTIVNLFVATPLVAPLRELAIVAVAATGIDFFLSYGVRRFMARTKIQRRQASPAVSVAPPAPMATPASAGALMFCRECGKQIPRDSKFCQACGARLA